MKILIINKAPYYGATGGKDMVLQKEDYVQLVCMCCMNVRDRKKLLEIGMNYRDGSTITIIHSCPSCGKASTATYDWRSGGPLNKNEGYQLKGYPKTKRRKRANGTKDNGISANRRQ